MASGFERIQTRDKDSIEARFCKINTLCFLLDNKVDFCIERGEEKEKRRANLDQNLSVLGTRAPESCGNRK